ncbi:MAG: hypothetical protein ACJA1I_000523 [Zhongshania marina]|jgi:hypothetical protein
MTMADNKLVAIEKGPNPVVIEYLTLLLEEAKSGDLQDIVCVMSYRGNRVNSLHTQVSDNRMRLIGELEQIKFHLLAREL